MLATIRRRATDIATQAGAQQPAAAPGALPAAPIYTWEQLWQAVNQTLNGEDYQRVYTNALMNVPAYHQLNGPQGNGQYHNTYTIHFLNYLNLIINGQARAGTNDADINRFVQNKLQPTAQAPHRTAELDRWRNYVHQHGNCLTTLEKLIASEPGAASQLQPVTLSTIEALAATTSTRTTTNGRQQNANASISQGQQFDLRRTLPPRDRQGQYQQQRLPNQRPFQRFNGRRPQAPYQQRALPAHFLQRGPERVQAAIDAQQWNMDGPCIYHQNNTHTNRQCRNQANYVNSLQYQGNRKPFCHACGPNSGHDTKNCELRRQAAEGNQRRQQHLHRRRYQGQNPQQHELHDISSDYTRLYYYHRNYQYHWANTGARPLFTYADIAKEVSSTTTSSHVSFAVDPLVIPANPNDPNSEELDYNEVTVDVFEDLYGDDNSGNQEFQGSNTSTTETFALEDLDDLNTKDEYHDARDAMDTD